MDWRKVLSALFDLLAIVRSWLAKQAGIDAEQKRALEKQREQDAIADKARQEAARDHATKQGDDAFDTSFRRD